MSELTLREAEGADSTFNAWTRRLVRVLAGVLTLLAIGVLTLGVLHAVRTGRIFEYTEAPVFASLTAFRRAGSLSALYPVGGWTAPPLVLTLYPPIYFVLSAAVMAIPGVGGSLLAPRLVGCVALAGCLAALIGIARTRGHPWTWAALLAGGALVLVPGIRSLAGSAQVDVLAMFWTLAGVRFVLRARALEAGAGSEGEDSASWGSGSGARSSSAPAAETRRTTPLLAAAAAFFVLAVFTKQSFVAAPIALVLDELRRGRTRRALVGAAGFVCVVGAGMLVLQSWTNGGYLLNTVGALGHGFEFQNVTAVLADAKLWMWAPLLGLLIALLAAGRQRRRRPASFAVLYAALAWVVHGTATLKTGSSINYFLEPVFASVLLVFTLPAPTPQAILNRVRSGPHLLGTASLLGMLAVAVPAGQDLVSNLAEVWRHTGLTIVMNGLDGRSPLVDASAFPDVIRAGSLPFLNDPYAFGLLSRAGMWNASVLGDRLQAGDVPFVLTVFDLMAGRNVRVSSPAGGAGFAYFWYLDDVWQPIVERYAVHRGPGFFVWQPRGERDASRDPGSAPPRDASRIRDRS